MFGAIGGGGVTWLFLLLVALLIGLAMFAFWLWMLIHAVKNMGLTEKERTIWVVVIALVHFFGAVIYFFVGRPKAKLVSVPPI